MSASFQVFFPEALRSVTPRFSESSIPESGVEALLTEAREEAAAQVRQQYEAQINDLRTEAVEFHQQFLGHLQETLEKWMEHWEADVPKLVFSGVRAVLADFEFTDEQLHAWLNKALRDAGAGEKGHLEVNLSADNIKRLEAYWKENGLSLPKNCRLRLDDHCSPVDCRVVGQKGIVDASLPVRLSQLSRLWRVSP